MNIQKFLQRQSLKWWKGMCNTCFFHGAFINDSSLLSSFIRLQKSPPFLSLLKAQNKFLFRSYRLWSVDWRGESLVLCLYASVSLPVLAVVSLGRSGLSVLLFALPQSEILCEQREMILCSLCLFLMELALWAVMWCWNVTGPNKVSKMLWQRNCKQNGGNPTKSKCLWDCIHWKASIRSCLAISYLNVR